jgi:hypothetical protein
LRPQRQLLRRDWACSDRSREDRRTSRLPAHVNTVSGCKRLWVLATPLGLLDTLAFSEWCVIRTEGSWRAGPSVNAARQGRRNPVREYLSRLGCKER